MPSSWNASRCVNNGMISREFCLLFYAPVRQILPRTSPGHMENSGIILRIRIRSLKTTFCFSFYDLLCRATGRASWARSTGRRGRPTGSSHAPTLAAPPPRGATPPPPSGSCTTPPGGVRPTSTRSQPQVSIFTACTCYCGSFGTFGQI